MRPRVRAFFSKLLGTADTGGRARRFFSGAPATRTRDETMDSTAGEVTVDDARVLWRTSYRLSIISEINKNNFRLRVPHPALLLSTLVIHTAVPFWPSAIYPCHLLSTATQTSHPSQIEKC